VLVVRSQRSAFVLSPEPSLPHNVKEPAYQPDPGPVGLAGAARLAGHVLVASVLVPSAPPSSAPLVACSSPHPKPSLPHPEPIGPAGVAQPVAHVSALAPSAPLSSVPLVTYISHPEPAYLCVTIHLADRVEPASGLSPQALLALVLVPRAHYPPGQYWGD
jgi:hypothetical protein